MAETEPPERHDKQKEPTRRRNLLLAGGVVVAYLLFGVVLWWTLDQYIDQQLAQALELIMMVGVAEAILIVYFAWRLR